MRALKAEQGLNAQLPDEDLKVDVSSVQPSGVAVGTSVIPVDEAVSSQQGRQRVRLPRRQAEHCWN